MENKARKLKLLAGLNTLLAFIAMALYFGVHHKFHTALLPSVIAAAVSGVWTILCYGFIWSFTSEEDQEEKKADENESLKLMPKIMSLLHAAIMVIWTIATAIIFFHVWKYAATVLGLTILILVAYRYRKWLRKGGRFVWLCGRYVYHYTIRRYIVRPLRLVYHFFVGQPRYWYVHAYDRGYGNNRKEERVSFTFSYAKVLEETKYMSSPLIIYIPRGGLFRDPTLTGAYKGWRVVRRFLGFKGAYLVDEFGNRFMLKLRRTYSSPAFGVYNEEWNITPEMGVSGLDIDWYWNKAPLLVANILRSQSLAHSLDRLTREKGWAEEKRDEARHEVELHQKWRGEADAEYAQMIAKVIALLGNKTKLRLAKKVLTALLERLVHDKTQRDAMLFEAQEAVARDKANEAA